MPLVSERMSHFRGTEFGRCQLVYTSSVYQLDTCLLLWGKLRVG
jgi:hypothetical protein